MMTRTLIPSVFAAWMIVFCPCWAAEQYRRFLEFPNEDSTTSYDLSTVQIVQPGRFWIYSTTIDNPDVMEFELKALNILRAYCARPVGKYPAPADLFSLGPPDMPVKQIEVSRAADGKTLIWYYPYKRLGDGTRLSFLICRGSKTEAHYFLELRAEITNGSRRKQMFDCKRGLSGLFFNEHDDPSKAITSFVKPGTVGEDQYARVCLAVMNEMPYLPERPGLK
jgi:hypothetical protein